MKIRKRYLSGLLVGGVVFATAFGMAATLGTVDGNELGAGDGAVGSCDTDGVSTTYSTAWDATDKRYEVSSVTVSDIHDNCDGEELQVALTDSSNVKLGDGSMTIPVAPLTTSVTVDTSSASPSAASVSNVHVVIG